MEKRAFKNTISFDKKEIRKRIFVPTFRQARRFADIYDGLIKEFYEEGCLTSAKYFQKLINKERSLYENAAIRDRIADEPQLLLSLFDNCKMAEKAAYSGSCTGPATCTHLLLQCILVFENHDIKFDWILLDVFKIIIKIAALVCEPEHVSKEYLCKIYYKFGKYLMKKQDVEEAVKYFEYCFDLCQGTNWTHKDSNNDNKSFNFSSIIARQYASALLNYANSIFYATPSKAINQAQKSLVILTREGIQYNEAIYINANLYMADFQIKTENYENGLLILEYIIKLIRPRIHQKKEYLKFKSRYNHLKGVCFKCIKKYDLALIELYKSLEIIRQLNMKYQEGNVLMDISKVYIARGRSQFAMAQSCLGQAKEIFFDLKDSFNTKKASYLMANLKVQNIQPQILDLIKFSSTNYCDKYRLIRWKSICMPFWRNLRYAVEKEEQFPVYCILEATEIPARKGIRKSFQRKPPHN